MKRSKTTTKLKRASRSLGRELSKFKKNMKSGLRSK